MNPDTEKVTIEFTCHQQQQMLSMFELLGTDDAHAAIIMQPWQGIAFARFVSVEQANAISNILTGHDSQSVNTDPAKWQVQS